MFEAKKVPMVFPQTSRYDTFWTCVMVYSFNEAFNKQEKSSFGT